MIVVFIALVVVIGVAVYFYNQWQKEQRGKTKSVGKQPVVVEKPIVVPLVVPVEPPVVETEEPAVALLADNPNSNNIKSSSQGGDAGCFTVFGVIAFFGVLLAIFTLVYFAGDEKNDTSTYDSMEVYTNNNTNTVKSSNYHGVTKNQAYLSLQYFVKQKLTNPRSADFDSNIVFEKGDKGDYIALGKVVASNKFGVETEYMYKIWLLYNGKDWTEQSNWNYSKFILENIHTQEKSTFYNHDLKPRNDTSSTVLGTIEGIECINIERNDSAIRISTSEKLTETQVEKMIKEFSLENKTIYLHLPSKTARGTEYGYRSKDLILFYD